MYERLMPLNITNCATLRRLNGCLGAEPSSGVLGLFWVVRVEHAREAEAVLPHGDVVEQKVTKRNGYTHLRSKGGGS